MAARKSRLKSRAIRKLDPDLVAPSRERKAHGTIEVIDRLADDAGRISRPYRSVDLLTKLERRGLITPEMRLAGSDFQAQFSRAGLEALKSSDFSRVVVSGRAFGDASVAVYDARAAIWEILTLCGGVSSVNGSCLWAVLGLEWSIERWTDELRNTGRQINRHQGVGLLIGTLPILVKYYGY